MSWWRLEGARLVLELHVQPGARRSEVAGLHGGRLKIRLAARATQGAANEALRELLAELLQTRKSDVRIDSGETSRRKRVSVLGARRAPESLLSA
ncbi:MAG: DUF167 domain-containing protein [Betaproteobacteria bacterium]|nr:DUF167 domain-containing protein [Betaproteobacteria bacterium]